MKSILICAFVISLILLSQSQDDLLLGSSGPVLDFSNYEGGAVYYPNRSNVSKDRPSYDGTKAEDNQENEVLIVEVYYNSFRDDEYISIFNSGPQSLDLSGWVLTDLEGSAVFPHGSMIQPGKKLYITRNSTSFHEDTLIDADFQYKYGEAPSMLTKSTLRLNNDGDEVLLKDDEGKVVDAFIYGYSQYSGDGWSGPPAEKLNQGKIARRKWGDGIYIDSNRSQDWDGLRVYGIGQSDFQSKVFLAEGETIAFSSPDSSFKVLSEEMNKAGESIYISAYKFTSLPLSDHLLQAIKRGVRVRVFLEGGPVQGVEEGEMSIAQKIAKEGGEVRFMIDNHSLDIHNRYRFIHGKYAIIDNSTFILSSENLGENGFPENRSAGNRGWGIAVKDKQVASYFSRVFLEDWNPLRRDSVSINEVSLPARGRNESSSKLKYEPQFQSAIFKGKFFIRTVIAPDTSLSEETIIGMIKSCQKYILLEQFYIHKNWGARENPYLEEVVEAARRGCQVKVLLDGSPYNIEENNSADNDDTIRYLLEIAEKEGLSIEAKLFNSSSHGLLKLHNKGMIVDGRRVLLSSINWNKNSVTENREVGVIVEREDIASYFQKIFFFDWKDDIQPPTAEAGPDRRVMVGEIVYFTALDSYDNVGIVNYSWDFDGDGIIDSYKPVASYAFERPGNYVVSLKVKDFWGNWDEDNCIVEVWQEEYTTNRSIESFLVLISLLVLAIIALTSVLLFRKLRRKEQKINKERNI